jgi:hypothetical protein
MGISEKIHAHYSYSFQQSSSSELTFFMKSAQKRAIYVPTVSKAVAH